MSNDKVSEVTSPADVFVRCPMAGWKLRQLRRCDGCAHFHGLAQRMTRDNAPLPFVAEFLARCAFPVDRDLVQVDIEALKP